MILAAGFGTRLRPLTLELPKPLVWVGARPAIAVIASRLVAAGVREIVLNAHHHAEAFSAEILARVPGEISVVVEAEILGTGGGVANAAPLLGDGDVVVWNGDILAPFDASALLAAHEEGLSRGAGAGTSGGPGATLAITPRARGEGTVGVGEGGCVVRLRGERFGEELAGGDYLGIAVLGPGLRGTLKAPGCLVGDGYLPWLRSGGRLGSFAADVAWDDIGSIEAYLRANMRWLAGAGGGAHVGEGARIEEGVDVTGSVIGEGAIVRGRGLLERCVVWPGATATAPLADAVVTTAGRVVKASGGG